MGYDDSARDSRRGGFRGGRGGGGFNGGRGNGRFGGGGRMGGSGSGSNNEPIGEGRGFAPKDSDTTFAPREQGRREFGGDRGFSGDRRDRGFSGDRRGRGARDGHSGNRGGRGFGRGAVQFSGQKRRFGDDDEVVEENDENETKHAVKKLKREHKNEVESVVKEKEEDDAPKKKHSGKEKKKKHQSKDESEEKIEKMEVENEEGNEIAPPMAEIIAAHEERLEEEHKRTLFVKGFDSKREAKDAMKLHALAIDALYKTGSGNDYGFLIFASEDDAETAHADIKKKKGIVVKYTGKKSPKTDANKPPSRPLDAKVLRINEVPLATTKDDVRALFSTAAKTFVLPAKKIKDTVTSTYAIVHFKNENDAWNAFQKGSTLKINGRQLSVLYGNSDMKKEDKQKKLSEEGMIDSKKLFVRGLPPNTTANDIREAFPGAADIIKPKAKNNNNQFALVIFENENDAATAFAAGKDIKVRGKSVSMKYGRLKENQEKEGNSEKAKKDNKMESAKKKEDKKQKVLPFNVEEEDDDEEEEKEQIPAVETKSTPAKKKKTPTKKDKAVKKEEDEEIPAVKEEEDIPPVKAKSTPAKKKNTPAKKVKAAKKEEIEDEEE